MICRSQSQGLNAQPLHIINKLVTVGGAALMMLVDGLALSHHIQNGQDQHQRLLCTHWHPMHAAECEHRASSADKHLMQIMPQTVRCLDAGGCRPGSTRLQASSTKFNKLQILDRLLHGTELMHEMETYNQIISF